MVGTDPALPHQAAPFDRQGVTEADLIDLTPELEKEARAILAEFVSGPLFTPTIVAGEGGKKGMLQLPGQAGGANWSGAAFDPESGVLFVPSQTRLGSMSLVPPSARQPSDRDYLPAFVRPDGPQGLPLVKPPWSRVTAIDLNRGEILWQIPLGDGPREHPALAGLDLPRLGTVRIASLAPGWPMVTKTLLFVLQAVSREPADGQTSLGGLGGLLGGAAYGILRAYDKATGKLVSEREIDRIPGGAPMTYVVDGRQFIVVPVGGRGETQELVAFHLASAR